MNTTTKTVEPGVKGRKPRLVPHVSTFIQKHGSRLPIADIDTAIAELTNLRQLNVERAAQAEQTAQTTRENQPAQAVAA